MKRLSNEVGVDGWTYKECDFGLCPTNSQCLFLLTMNAIFPYGCYVAMVA